MSKLSVPLCFNCKHHMFDDRAVSLCAHPVNTGIRTSLVSGEFSMPECEQMRSGREMDVSKICDEAGYLFEASKNGSAA